MKYLSDFEYFKSFRRYLPLKLAVVRSRAKFCMLLAHDFLRGGRKPPKFLDPIFKTQPAADHGAKFRAVRHTELGDTVAKQKKTAGKHKSAPKAIASGRINYLR